MKFSRCFLLLRFSMAAGLISGMAGFAGAQQVVATVPVFGGVDSIAVNTKTNTAYVVSSGGGLIAINPFNNTGSPGIVVGDPAAVAVNELTNKVYVGTTFDFFVDDPPTDNAIHLNIGQSSALAVNPVTNKIYVQASGNVQVVDGVTNAV